MQQNSLREELTKLVVEAHKENAVHLHEVAAEQDKEKGPNSHRAQVLRAMADISDGIAERLKHRREPLPAEWRNNGVCSDLRHASGSSSIVQVDSLKLLPWVIVSILLCGVSVALAALLFFSHMRTERETRLLQYYIMELDGKLMKQGIIEPRDSLSGQQQKREEPKK